MAKPRIIIPKNITVRLKLANQINDRHTTLATASPLKSMEDNDWSYIGKMVTETIDLQSQIESRERKLEELTKARNLNLETIDPAIKASRDLLVGVHSRNIQKLGDYGFEVNATTAAAKTPVA
jgi:methyl coenzyme M reductase gamma subunit